MKKRIITFFIILFNFVILFGQVYIKETISLNETTLKKKSNNIHTCRVVITWDNPKIAVAMHIYGKDWKDIKYTDYDYDMSQELSLENYTPQTNLVRFRFSVPFNEKTTYKVDFYVDNQLVTSHKIPNQGDGSYIDKQISQILAYDIGLIAFDSGIIHGQGINENVKIVYSRKKETITLLNLLKEPVKLSIIEGKDLFELRYIPKGKYDDVSLGSEFTFYYWNQQKLGDILFIAPYYSSSFYPRLNIANKENKLVWGKKRAILKMECGPIVKYDTLNIEGPEPENYILSWFSDQLYAGDTVNVNLQRQRGDDPPRPFEPGQLFEVGIEKGCEFAKILTSDFRTGDYFDSLKQPIRIVLEEDITTDSLKLKLKVGAISDTITYYDKNAPGVSVIISKAGIYKNNDLNNKCEDYNYKLYYYTTLEDSVEKPVEIMLGETKYFQLIRKPKAGAGNFEYKIKEVKKFDSKGVPLFDKYAITNKDVWLKNPIQVTSGNKSGVHWGKTGIPQGMLKVIGRFWSKETNFSVYIQASGLYYIIKKKLKVITPDKLLTDENKRAYKYYVDVNNKTVNMDSICILYGGKYGIPPHLIKGQIFKEAGKKNFGGNIGWAFTPSYRYEPFTTQWDKYLKSWSGKYYFKDSTSADFSNIPDHKNVMNMEYFTEVKTVWEVINEYSQLQDKNNPSDFGERKSDNTMNFYPKFFKRLQNKYDAFLDYYKKVKKIKNTAAGDSANLAMANWFKNTWKGGRAKNVIAQTRCASSYGLLQMLYTTAREKIKYNKSLSPEKMNENDMIESFIKAQKDYLITYLGKDEEKKSNWQTGYIESFKASIFDPWNSADTYSKSVLGFSNRFLPRKNGGKK